MGVLAAERIKLTSTRAPWWGSAVVIVLSLGMAILVAVSFRLAAETPGAAAPLEADSILTGVSDFGILVLSILATLSVTSEYRFGIIRTTFQAVPQRHRVLLGKTLLFGVYGAALTTVLAFVALALAKVSAGRLGDTLVMSGHWRAVYAIPIIAFLHIALAMAIGALVRQSAAAISILVLWQLVIEELLGMFGTFGRNAKPYLPFQNAARFSNSQEVAANWHWNVWGSLVYFTAFVVLIYVAALYWITEKDA